jgi:hypothetical protein
MKKVFTALMFFISVLITQAQSGGDYSVNIYTNIQSLNNHTPDKKAILNITEKKTRYGFWGLTSKDSLTFYHTRISSGQAKELGKVLAYEINDNLYLKTGINKIHKRAKFALASMAGKYPVYTDKWVYIDRRIPLIAFTYPQPMFVDFKTGKKLPFARATVRRMIKDNALLLRAFKGDKNRATHFAEYLIAYSHQQSQITSCLN